MEQKNNLPATQGSTAPAVFNFFDKDQFEVMQRVCKMFASSELVPDMYKTDLTLKDGKPVNPENKAMANCMIAIEMAQRIGASPLMIMQNMVIIYGRPSWSSKFLVATVNTCGRFEPLKYRFTNRGMVGKLDIVEYAWNDKTRRKEAIKKEFDGTNIENLECVAYTCAKGSDEVLESAPITIKLAIQEGWCTKAGSKWQTMTRQMLMYRAASFWTNAYAPELSMGMKTEDEIRDIIDIDYEDVTEKVDQEKKSSANKEAISIDDDEKPEGKQEEKPEASEKPQGGTQEPAPTQKAQETPETKPEGQNQPEGQPAGQGNDLFEGQQAGGTRKRGF